MNKTRNFFVMKLIYYVVFLVLAMVLTAPAQTSVRFTFANGQYNISQYTNVQVILQPEQLNSSGTVTIGTAKIYRTTDTNASVTFSNLAGSYTGGYYHWTVPAFTSPNGYNPPVTIQGDIQVVSTNLGLIDSTTIGVIFPPVYSGFGAAWTAQAADQRYSVSSNNLSSYVQIGQLTATSNSLAASIVAATNGMTSIVYSNPSAFVTPNQATNIAQGAYNSNPSNYATLPQVATTNLATLTTVTSLVTSATNGLLRAADAASTYYPTSNPSSFVNQTALTATNTAILAAIANTNAANLVITTNLISNATNGLATSASVGVASNALAQAKQPSSAILTNLANTGAFTNSIAAGTNIVFVTNGSTITISATVTNSSGGTTYTNNASGLPGVVLGSGIGTNLTSYALKTDATNAANVVYLGNANNYISNFQLSATLTNLILVGITNRGNVVNYYPLAGLFANSNGASFLQNFGVGNASGGGQYLQMQWVSYGNDADRIGALNQTRWFTFDYLPGGESQIRVSQKFKYSADADLAGQTISNGNFSGFFFGDGSGLTNIPESAVSNLTADLAELNTTNRFVTVLSGNATNLSAWQQFSLGTKTNFLITTNLVGIIGSGSPTVDGTYINTANGSTWTNPFDARMTILLSAPTYFLQSNSVSLYSSTNIVTWVVVNGANPVPVGAWGSVWHMNGTQLKGIVWSTNITAQILAAQSAFAATGSVAAATSATFAGIASNSPLGTFGTAAIVDTNRFLAVGAGGYRDGILVTNISGTNLVAGTVSSNAFDAGTLAQLYNISSGTNDAVLQISNNQLVKIIGGTLNTNSASTVSIIVGGRGNTVLGTSYSAILGGWFNGMGNTANYSTMLGGQYNTNLLADFATVVGGQYNLLTGDWSTILGGTNNQSLASYTSILGGNGGRAAHQGVTIIADSQSTSNRSFTNDMMLLRFANGVTINTNNPNGYALNVFGTINATNVLINGSAISGGSTAGAVTTNMVNNGNVVYVMTNGTASGVRGQFNAPFALPSQAVAVMQSNDTMVVYSGAYVEGTNKVVLPKNTSMIGLGTAKIYYSCTNSGSSVAVYIVPGDNCVVKDLWLYSTTGTNKFNCPFGFENGSASATNVLFQNLNAPTCDSDGYYNNASAFTDGKIIGGSCFGYWDCYTWGSGLNANSTWLVDGVYADSSLPGSTASRRPFNVNAGKITIRNTYVRSVKSGTGNVGIYVAGGTVSLQNILFDISGSGYYDVQGVAGTVVRSGLATKSGLPISEPAFAALSGAVTINNPLAGFLTIPTDTNQIYGTWSFVYNGDQDGSDTTKGGMATLTNAQNSQAVSPVSIDFIPDNYSTNGGGLRVNAGKLFAGNGFLSYATNAAVSLGAAGVTNNMGCNAGAYVTATATSWIIKNRANATIYTSPTLTATVYVHLQPGWSVSAASGLAGTLLPE
jgi:hypothetical protein